MNEKKSEKGMTKRLKKRNEEGKKERGKSKEEKNE